MKFFFCRPLHRVISMNVFSCFYAFMYLYTFRIVTIDYVIFEFVCSYPKKKKKKYIHTIHRFDKIKLEHGRDDIIHKIFHYKYIPFISFSHWNCFNYSFMIFVLPNVLISYRILFCLFYVFFSERLKTPTKY